MPTLITGLFFGFSYVAPIGAQNSYVINSALRIKKSKILFFLAWLLFFDIALATACFYGIGLFIQDFPIIRTFLQVGGGIYILKLAKDLFFQKESSVNSSENQVPLTFTSIFVSLFVLTWMNPQAILDGIIVIGANKTILEKSQYINFLTGIAIASTTWFVTLFAVFYFFSKKIDTKKISLINKVCGIGMAYFGLKLLWSTLNNA